MNKKPNLSFWQIWNMSFGFLGIQFGFALQNANVSRIFETLGGDVSKLSVYWLAAPLTGLLVQPIIGYYSDKTWTKLGRRRPYFLVGAILASLTLFIMPNSPSLWIAVGTLWIMDASINVSMEPFRAFVGDMLPDRQRTFGFSMQSFFIGIGAVVASALPWVLANWFNVSNKGVGSEIGLSVKLAFYIGGAVFLLAVLWTVIRSKEYSPEQLKKFEEAEKESLANTKDNSGKGFLPTKKYYITGGILIIIGIVLSIPLFFIHVEKEVFILSFGLIGFGVFELLAGLMVNQKWKNGLTEIITDLNRMPKTMKQLSFVQFFSWFALFSMWIYTTSGVTSSKYDMKLDKTVYEDLNNAVNSIPGEMPDTKSWENFENVKKDLNNYGKRFAEGKDVVASVRVVNLFLDKENKETLKVQASTLKRLDTILDEYNKGADLVGILMAVYNGAAAFLAFLIIFLARIIKRTTVHAICLVIGGMGLSSFYFISNPNMLIFSEIGIGLAWASILAMPYAILTQSLPANKMGVYMGIFNFFIVIPQIVAASILGFCVRFFFDGKPIYALLVGGVSLLIAAILVVFVKDVKVKNS